MFLNIITFFESKSRFPLFQSLINNSRIVKLIIRQPKWNGSSKSHVHTPKESVHVHAITSIFPSISFKNFPALFFKEMRNLQNFWIWTHKNCRKKALRTINRCPCARWKQFLLSTQNSFVSPSPQILIFIFKLFFFLVASNHPLYHVTRHRVNRISRHFSLGRLWYFLFWFSILSYFDTRVKPWRQILVSLPAPSDSLAQTYLLSPSPRHHLCFFFITIFSFFN